MDSLDSFKCLRPLKVGSKTYAYFSLPVAEKYGLKGISRLPFSLKVLLENLLRNEDGRSVSKEDIQAVAQWLKTKTSSREIAFRPARVLMQDFTGVPAVVDLAAMRDAMDHLGGDAKKINPLVPVDLVIDHSVAVNFFGHKDSFKKNVEEEYKQNQERYKFLKWAARSFTNFRVVPPGTGICHQVNLEYLSQTVWSSPGQVKVGMTATDLVLTVTQMLRKRGVVGKFVEFFGPGLAGLTIADRATLGNMAPEYGATCGFFPIGQATIDYLVATGRTPERAALVEAYAKAQGMWHEPGAPEPEFTDTIDLDLANVTPSLAGPKRPQDRVALTDAAQSFGAALGSEFAKTGEHARTPVGGEAFDLGDGDVVIAAITSCTNTSNPSVLIAAGLLAKKALEKGLKVKPWVKTSLAPGSQVVTDYLVKAGLQKPLDALGFNLVGYGCTTCIGNSGPLAPAISEAISTGDLVAVSVLSGNRNFEGRVNPDTRANYLASPPLVVAYALAGSMNIDLTREPLGEGKDGEPVFLRDIWPTTAEIAAVQKKSVTPAMFAKRYGDVFKGDKSWQGIKVAGGQTYAWDPGSTYVQNPPYFENMSMK